MGKVKVKGKEIEVTEETEAKILAIQDLMDEIAKIMRILNK